MFANCFVVCNNAITFANEKKQICEHLLYITVGGVSYNSESRKQEPLYVYLGIRKGTPSDLRRECLFPIWDLGNSKSIFKFIVSIKDSLKSILGRFEKRFAPPGRL